MHSDWDRIDTGFTGLRGFGNVAWYPVSAPPVILGDGSRLFDEIGDQKSRMAPANFHLRITAEFPHGQAPTIALVNGHPVPLAVTDSETSGIEVSGVATGESQTAPLGFEAPSLFLAIRTSHTGANLTAFTRPENDAWASSWTLAEKPVAPFLQQWLGDKPRTQLILLDLPDPHDAPYETGPLLVTAIKDADPEQLKFTLAHALTHAWLYSQPAPPLQAWLSEGIPYFMGTLWTEQQYGRTKALEMLEDSRSALALAEPETPGQSPGQPLSSASTPVYYRTKAAYVFWMLHDIAGDDALSAALRTEPQSTAGFEAALQKSATADLHWFFADWVDADRGLPDLSIEKSLHQPGAGRQLARCPPPGQRGLRRRNCPRHRPHGRPLHHATRANPRPWQNHRAHSHPRASSRGARQRWLRAGDKCHRACHQSRPRCHTRSRKALSLEGSQAAIVLIAREPSGSGTVSSVRRESGNSGSQRKNRPAARE